VISEARERPQHLPTGTVTFLFTDIEGSTRLIQSLGDRYLAVLQDHRAIIEDAVHANGGAVFGTEGDAVFAAFPEVVPALDAALVSQRGLASRAWPDGHELRVRMGIHTGEVVLVGGDYVGLTLHRVARVAAAAHGGQVLLSEASRTLASGSLQDGIGLRDLGEHRLKDLSRPERLFQLTADGLPDSFPALRTLEVKPNNLPPQLTTFVGREEVETARRLLAGTRLLTLTGPGGTGKTRLALQLAAESMDAFPDGTWFVPLDAVDDPGLVPSAIVQALGLEAGSQPPLELLIEYLRGRPMLLVLDNFEQVVDAATTISRIIRETSETKIVVTSRVVLRAYGEQELPIPPLGLPDVSEPRSAEEAARSEAVRLFVERAMASSPSFRLTDENAPAVADIVRRLDGLPLAIELAAARTRILPLEALRARLDQRLALLTGGARDLPERQQTLRGAIDWSYDLLEEPDRLLFERVGVFAGGACLTQAEAVCGPASELGQEVLDGLASLSEKSLVRSLPDADVEPRFAMLATIREYALERSLARGELEALRDRHVAAYLALVESSLGQLGGSNRRRLLDRLGLDHDNLRAAFDWAIERRQALAALRLATGLWRFWQTRGHLLEGRSRMDRALALAQTDGTLSDAVLAEAYGAAGGLSYWLGDMDATRSNYETALDHARRAGEPRLLAEALYNAGFGHKELADGRAVYVGARRYFEDALAAYETLGDGLGIANAHWALGLAATDERDVIGARQHTEEALRRYEAVGDAFGAGWSHHIVGLLDLVEERADDAEPHFRAALDIFAAAYDQSAIVILLLDFAGLAQARGDRSRYWYLAAASDSLGRSTATGLADASIEFLNWRRPQRPTDDAEAETAWARGATLTIDEAIEELYR
jgi:predicted ATPase/class 3 adenylate cyclase